MELWDAYNREGQRTGGTLVRGKPIPRGLYHLVCEVLVRHTDGDYLLMKRAATKPAYPGYYEATAGGSALKGEDPLQCIRRELMEETGLCCRQFTEVDRQVIDRDKAIFVSFVCTVDVDKQSIRLQEGETEDFMWLGEEAFRAFLRSGKAIPTQVRRFSRYLLLEAEAGA